MKSFSQIVAAFTLALLGTGTALAQASATAPYGLEVSQAPVLQVGVQYQATHANAPPGQCGCFWMSGGGAQVNLAVRPNWSLGLDVAYASASNIVGTDETLSVFNYTIGPRYSYWNNSRYTPYGQILAGGSHVSSDYKIYSAGRSALALQAGLGVNVYVTPHYSVVPLEVNWVYSQEENNVNARQNNLRVGAGVVYRFGYH